MADPLYISEHDALTNETIVREMTAAEIAELPNEAAPETHPA